MPAQKSASARARQRVRGAEALQHLDLARPRAPAGPPPTRPRRRRARRRPAARRRRGRRACGRRGRAGRRPRGTARGSSRQASENVRATRCVVARASSRPAAARRDRCGQRRGARRRAHAARRHGARPPVGRHEPRGDLGAEQHARHAGARVRPAAREVEPGEPPVAVRLAEVGRLVQRRLDARTRCPTPRRGRARSPVASSGARRATAVVAARPARSSPRGRRAARRAAGPPSRSQSIPARRLGTGSSIGERVAAGRRHRGLGARRRVDVGGERPRQLAAARHRADELAVAVADEQRVVPRAPSKRRSRAEVEQEAGHRLAQPPARRRGGRRARACAGRRRWRPRRRPRSARRRPAGRRSRGRPRARSRADRLAAAHVERPRHRLDHASTRRRRRTSRRRAPGGRPARA